MLSASRREAFWAFLLTIALLSSTNGWARRASIVAYTATSVTRSQLADASLEHWAQYQTLCDSPGAARKIPLVDSLNRVFENVATANARFPFYAWGNSSWYVSSMGFLSPTPYGMCNGYCAARFFADLGGTYAFSSDTSVLYGGGGDWPMIGLYAMPFETTAASASESFILTLDSSADGAAYTAVEYCSVPALNQAATAEARLTAQVVVYANGTIIMRYASLPDTRALPAYMPSTGLIYSKTLRTVVPTPTAANGIAAYRFDPVLDACAGHGDAPACTADTGRGCVWCFSTSACCAGTLVSEVCPRGQWTAPASSTAAFTPQQFYDVTVDFDTPFVSMEDRSRTFALASGYFPLALANPQQNIPLFRTPSLERVYCIPGASCPMQTNTHPCGLLGNTCVNGNYTFSILALESEFIFAKAGRWDARVLPQRSHGEELCEEAAGCAEGVVGRLTGAAFSNHYSSMPLFSVQLYADISGVVDVTIQCASCAPGDPMLAHPPMRVGLVRHGVDDASSVMIPQGLLRSGLHVRFVPKSSCVDCGVNGWCDESSGTCHCQPGYYGKSCAACPACWAGSECDDGSTGSGTCLCKGEACEAACAGTSGGSMASGSCAGCDAVGGRCNCGVCECQGGWGGADCNVAPADACRAYSFDGCEVCGQHEGCVFCHDSTCFNPALSATPGGYTCSYSTPAADTQACVTYRSRGWLSPISASGLSAAGTWVTVGAVMAGFIMIYVVCWCFSHQNRRDLTVQLAVGTTPTFLKPYREREVVQFDFTRERSLERELMGIPLRQVSLQRLFKRRKENLMREH